jgi:large subunit ribosomal protein L4
MTVEIQIYSNEGISSAKHELNAVGFQREFNEDLVHQLICHYQAGARAGTSAQKTRSEVRGGGKKPWAQKGGGRARAGTIRSPIWRSGGVTFAGKTRSFANKINKKMYRAAIQCIFSELARQQRLVLGQGVLAGAGEEIRTKELHQILQGIDARRMVLLVDSSNEQLERAANNIPDVLVMTTNSINPVVLVGADLVIASSEAIQVLEGRLG